MVASPPTLSSHLFLLSGMGPPLSCRAAGYTRPMAIRKVARLGHPVLRKKAEPVPEDQISSPAIQQIIDDLLVTMVEYDGAGLAAPQIHESVRIVIAVLDDDQSPHIWVNP